MTRKTKKKRTTQRPRWTIPDCKRFTGYKPCFPASRCYLECESMNPIGKTILLVNLDALGNVLVTTSILPAIRRKYPRSTIHWITLRSAAPLLENIPQIDFVWTWEPESWMILKRMKFDLLLNVDKSRRSGAFALEVDAKTKLGFGINHNGVIVPMNAEAEENYILGLDDHLKFRVNKKTVAQLQCEQFRLKYVRDEYGVALSEDEKTYCGTFKRRAGIEPGEFVVALNTGCSDLYPNKKMTIEQHVQLIGMLQRIPRTKVLLVGGPEDTQRNAEIARQVGDAVISTPTTEGLRRGLCYVNLCDVMVTGDSLGMHMAIGLKKHVIVWFGVSCAPEVELYGRGVKLVPEGLECSPCWKRECPYNLECISMVHLDAIVGEIERVRSLREVSAANQDKRLY